MELKELYAKYRLSKLALDKAEKEEKKYKALLKDAMKEAGQDDYTDEDGYTFIRSESTREKMDEGMVLESLKERGLTDCIKMIEAVDEDATAQAVADGRFPAEELQKAVSKSVVVALTMKAPGKKKRAE